MLAHLRTARARASFVTVLLAAGVVVSGCDLQEDSDLDRGRDLFVQECGVCHALTEARTAAEIGPDLDSSFAEARSNGMDQDTIEGVVAKQIEFPRDADPSNTALYMPAGIVEGRDAEAVASYVASVAGVPGIMPPELGDGMEIFVDTCGGCHQLDAANTAGGVGPDLDEVLPGQSAAMIANSIRAPQDEISPGFGDPSIMPVYDANTIPDQNLDELVQYLLDSVGGNSSSASGGDGGGNGSGKGKSASGNR